MALRLADTNMLVSVGGALGGTFFFLDSRRASFSGTSHFYRSEFVYKMQRNIRKRNGIAHGRKRREIHRSKAKDSIVYAEKLLNALESE